MTKIVAVAAMVACTALATFGQRTTGNKTSYQENVTTVVHDLDTAGSQLLLRSDDFNGTDSATYVTTNTNGGQVNGASFIQSDGTYKLEMATGRTLWITPNDAVTSGEPAGPAAGFYYGNIVDAHSKCSDSSGNVVPYENLVNGSGHCGFGVNFLVNGVQYTLVMGATLPGPGPATGLANVACNAVSNNQCVSWTITPNASAPNVNVANLYSFTGTNKQPWVFVGQYYNTFRIDITNP